MAMTGRGTFRYACTLSAAPGEDRATWRLRSLDAVEPSGKARADRLLLGLEPTAVVESMGIPPKAERRSPGGKVVPGVERSRITLTADDPEHANSRSALFFLASDLVRRLRAGDQVNLARNRSAGFGVSILRDERLVAAVGCITAVPLGKGVKAYFPRREILKAEEALQVLDPDYRMWPIPLAVWTGGETRLLSRGGARLGAYDVFIVDAAARGMAGIPGIPECVSLSNANLCSRTAASTSAELLSACGLKLERW